MCDAATRTVIQEVVQDKMDKREMFSAWDITKEVRQSGINERHGDVKRVVHAMFSAGDMSGYSRQTVDIPGVRPSPFIYHPDGTDPDEYLTQGKVDKSATASSTIDEEDDEEDQSGLVSAGKVRTTAKTDRNPDGSLDRTTGNEGYLYLPKAFIANLGLKPGDKVYVVQDCDKLQVGSTAGRIGSGPLVAQYAVDIKGNVRIPKSILSLIVQKPNASFRIELKSGEMIVVS